MSQIFPPSIPWWKIKYFDEKLNTLYLFFKSKYGRGRPETCIKSRFRAWNALLCMFPVFHYHILIWKTKFFINCYFLKEIWLKKNWDMHKLAFQGLKHTFMHVSGLPLPYFDLKNEFIKILVFHQIMLCGTLETCINMRFRAWNARLCMSQVFPQAYFDEKPNTL